MEARWIPGGALLAVGILLISVLAVSWPSTNAGGPAVAYAFFVILVLGGGGCFAIAVGIYSIRSERTRLPAVLLSGYGAVGIVYAVIRSRLFPNLSAVGFTIVASCFVALAIYVALRLTSSNTPRPSADQSKNA